MLLGWADEIRRLSIWGNADTPDEAALARQHGAEGIGLCRTEHMFREGDRLPIVQEMILSETAGERQRALDRLLPIQRADFVGILRAMDGLPVVIRLLDPPLHEFLPDHEPLAAELASLTADGSDPQRAAQLERMLRRVEELQEANPMLGLRGCRLGIQHPEIYEMQVRAIIEGRAGTNRGGRAGATEDHDSAREPRRRTAGDEPRLHAVADEVLRAGGAKVSYEFGTMIEVPRACLTAGELAKVADFFSFGTNDLTQTTYGIFARRRGGQIPH